MLSYKLCCAVHNYILHMKMLKFFYIIVDGGVCVCVCVNITVNVYE